jgi:hypothetical protein
VNTSTKFRALTIAAPMMLLDLHEILYIPDCSGWIQITRIAQCTRTAGIAHIEPRLYRPFVGVDVTVASVTGAAVEQPDVAFAVEGTWTVDRAARSSFCELQSFPSTRHQRPFLRQALKTVASAPLNRNAVATRKHLHTRARTNCGRA